MSPSRSGQLSARRRGPECPSTPTCGRDSALPHQRLKPNLKVLHIGRRALVENHEIEGELLHPQIFVSTKQLAGDVEVLGVGDAQQQDRQVAGNAQVARAPTARRRLEGWRRRKASGQEPSR